MIKHIYWRPYLEANVLPTIGLLSELATIAANSKSGRLREGDSDWGCPHFRPPPPLLQVFCHPSMVEPQKPCSLSILREQMLYSLWGRILWWKLQWESSDDISFFFNVPVRLSHHPWTWKVGLESCDRHPEEKRPFRRPRHGLCLPCRTLPPRWPAGRCRGPTRWGRACPTPPPAPCCKSGWRWGSTCLPPSPPGPSRCPLRTRQSSHGTSRCGSPPPSCCRAPPRMIRLVGRQVCRL